MTGRRQDHLTWVSNDLGDRTLEADERRLRLVLERVLDCLLERHRLSLGPGTGERLIAGWNRRRVLPRCGRSLVVSASADRLTAHR
jgi:hypothetical protein